MTPAQSALIIITWDGKSPPAALLTRDAVPEFSLMLFDYSGRIDASPDGTPLLSHATECKGQILGHVAALLNDLEDRHDWVGIIDDDVEIGISAINICLAAARAHGLSSCSAALTPDSAHSHPWTLQQPVATSGNCIRPVGYVEVMMPIYAVPLFRAASPLFRHSISSYGIDQFVFPMLQKLTGAGPAAIIDSAIASHRRPITSDRRVFSNGLTAIAERVYLRRLCIDWLRRERPALLGTAWYLDVFAPWNGPARFWFERLKYW